MVQIQTKFKQTEIGLIPEDWEVVELGEFGGLFPGYAFKSGDFSDNGAPIIKIKNINSDGTVDIQDTDKISKQIINDKISKYFIDNGDFIIAMTGATIGKTGMIKNTHEKLLLNQRVGKFFIKDSKKLSNMFLFYITQSIGFNQDIVLKF